MNTTPDPQLTQTKLAATRPTTETAPPGDNTDRVFEESLRELLHRRLRFCAWLSTISAIVLIVASFLFGGRGTLDETTGLFVYIAISIVGFVGIMLLRGRPSLTRLRAIEITLFTVMALLCGVLRVISNLGLDLDSPDPRHATIVIEYATALANFPVYFLMFFYALLIPTTRWRGLIVLVILAAIPLASIVASAFANRALMPHLPVLFVVTALGVTMTAVAAMFGLSRINTLQRRAFDAERRADQVGPYMLKKKLGAGGMGEVWLAEHRLLKRPCAVKFIRADLAANPMNTARFAREVRAVTTLTHFHTIRIYDYGQSDDGSFYYVMEYLDGPTLESLVQRAGPLPPERAIYLLRQLCGALAEAHAAGLVHRDLKPNNVIVAALGGQRDVAKLLDFGLVQDLSTVDSNNRLTQAGVVMGTPAYMCPEQASGSNAIDARGDIYSLGAVAFFILTARPPFRGNTVGMLINAHLTQPAPDVCTFRNDVPADVAAVVAKCLAKEPKERFQSAVELEAALSACACASAWSATHAAQWWTNSLSVSPTSQATITA